MHPRVRDVMKTFSGKHNKLESCVEVISGIERTRHLSASDVDSSLRLLSTFCSDSTCPSRTAAPARLSNKCFRPGNLRGREEHQVASCSALAGGDIRKAHTLTALRPGHIALSS